MWKESENYIDYEFACNYMENKVEQIINNISEEEIWLLEHNPLYSAGVSAKSKDLLNSEFLPVYQTPRGGQYTYHGPGQRIAYVMLNLAKRNQKDLKLYIRNLEQWIINSLAYFNVKAFARSGRVGIWVEKNGAEYKIAAIGVKIRKWVTFHGIAINVKPNLNNYQAIIPCGISKYGVTSLEDLGLDIAMEELDRILKIEFNKIFL